MKHETLSRICNNQGSVEVILTFHYGKKRSCICIYPACSIYQTMSVKARALLSPQQSKGGVAVALALGLGARQGQGGRTIRHHYVRQHDCLLFETPGAVVELVPLAERVRILTSERVGRDARVLVGQVLVRFASTPVSQSGVRTCTDDGREDL